VLAARHGRLHRGAVAGDEAEPVDDPLEDGLVPEVPVDDPVGQVTERLVEGHGEHAQVVGDGSPVVADDERRARSGEPFQAAHLVAVVGARGPEEGQPAGFGDAGDGRAGIGEQRGEGAGHRGGGG
jgi:hypothetical protein